MQPATALDDVAAGQRLVLYAILLNVTGMFLRVATGDLVVVTVGLAAAALAVVGLLRLGSGLGYSDGRKALLVVVSFVPLIGFLMLALVCGEATLKLRAAGYQVGLMGARR